MGETVLQVEAARIPDRDRLLRELGEHGIEAYAMNEVGIEVPVRGDAQRAAVELLAQIEHSIMVIGAPFVPVKHEGVIYVRPPVS